ncbi:hypothetical protein LWI28_008669 [Acer negundo]|uniref:Peroxidase n=1 Tax=Acer negundo TaxID=4023 RepID=A0AAD5IU01_ACENE|nr:hypothetical protein LWI28_008669 [Acer negundo]
MDNEEVITLTIGGAQINPIITLPSSSTILQLKRMIMERIGVQVERQHLLYNKILLKDNNIINHYIHEATAEVCLSVNLFMDERIINITVSNENFNLQLTVNKADKVIDLKNKIGVVFAFPAMGIDLWQMNRKMEEYEMLSKYYLNEGSVVKMSRIYGPFWEVPTGRRDGRVSISAETLNGNLPAPFSNISSLKQNFASKGLSVKDLVVLSGGHTIGTSHCSSFDSRLYNFTGKGDTDPSLDPNYVVHLKKICKPKDTTTIVEMDPGSFKTFDEDYYTLVAKRRGLFESDAALLNDNETRDYVKLQSATHGSTFAKDFAESMVKMGKIGVLTGKAGEIRKHCAFVI